MEDDEQEHARGVVHAWVEKNLLKCNELRPILRDRGRMETGARFAVAGVAAVQIGRCYGTDKAAARAVTAPDFYACRATKQ